MVDSHFTHYQLLTTNSCMILEITKEPAKVLRERAREVEPSEINAMAMQKLVADMKETMFAANGIGLAAPQVNQGLRLIIVFDGDQPITVFNPKIIKKSLLTVPSEEGCLSVSKKYGTVKRYKKLTVTGLDEQGEEFTAETTGLTAIIFQHEIDHLNGTLFIDKAKDIKHVA